MQRKERLRYKARRYEPPPLEYFDQDDVREYLGRTQTIITQKQNSPWPSSCPHCFQPRHGNPKECQNDCGLCREKHRAVPCARLYCTVRWWKRVWKCAPPEYVRLKPSAQDEELLIAANVLSRTGTKLEWHLETTSAEPVRREEAADENEMILEVHDAGAEAMLFVLDYNSYMSGYVPDLPIIQVFKSKKYRAPFANPTSRSTCATTLAEDDEQEKMFELHDNGALKMMTKRLLNKNLPENERTRAVVQVFMSKKWRAMWAEFFDDD